MERIPRRISTSSVSLADNISTELLTIREVHSHWTTATDTESPEGRLKTLDLWAKILTDRDSEWEEVKDIRPARETIGGKREGMKVNNIGIAGTRDDEETTAIAGKKHAE
ncbi:hypothetical protein BHE74_00054851 [Ensete ventricosum]|nr:hypothetical protein BHE74_00054851 [Ensete ventricosum]